MTYFLFFNLKFFQFENKKLWGKIYQNYMMFCIIYRRCYNNAYYAIVGGVSTLEMNKLELDFLFNLDFRLHVTPQIFAKYCMQLEK